MLQITIKDYDAALKQYRDYALSRGALDLFQCGTVKNPGVSDIDCILVLKDWDSLPRDIRFLNPECFSSLFAHGPFVVTADQLINLYRFTTLRPTAPEIQPSFERSFTQRCVVIAVRQSWSWSHLWQAIQYVPSNSERRLLLIAKSIYYTGEECLALSRSNLSLEHEVRDFMQVVERMRNQFLLEGNLDDRAKDDMKKHSIKILMQTGEVLAKWLVRETNTNGSETENIVRGFSLQTRDGWENLIFHDPEKTAEWRWMKSFLNEVVSGYALNGLGWRGAEFPFHNGADPLGWKLWCRRFIKRALIPSMRAMRHSRIKG